MVSLAEYQQQQLSKLEDRVSQLHALVGNIQAGCEFRHKTDLTLQLVRASKDLENLEKRVKGIENDIDQVKQNNLNLEARFTELKSQINIIILKVDELTNSTQKTKDLKNNFFIQIIIIVAAAIILGIIGFIWTHAWNSIRFSNVQQMQPRYDYPTDNNQLKYAATSNSLK